MARPSEVEIETEMSHRLATIWLLALWLVAGVVFGLAHMAMPLPPHSAHDGFLLIPQLMQLIDGATPDQARFGMFHPTWFSPHAIATSGSGWPAFWARLFANVQSHAWIDTPHPMALMAFVAAIFGGGTASALFVQWLYLGLLVFSLYAIGAKTRSKRAGFLAGALALGTPGVFGLVQYIEPHLAVGAMSTFVVALLLHTDGLRRPFVCGLASVALWSLSRCGEGSGEAVIAGLVVVGPVLMVVASSGRGLGSGRWIIGFVTLVVPFLMLADFGWMMAAMERVTRAFADPAVQRDVTEKGGLMARPAVWSAAYFILLFTDYFRPLMSVVAMVGLWGLRGIQMRQKWVVILWAVIPWVALSVMQRKSSWYGIILVPSVIYFVAIGLENIGNRALGRVAVVLGLGQFLVLSFTPANIFVGGAAWARDPLALHDWRMRRIDLLRPMDTVSNHRVFSELQPLIAWAKSHQGPIAVMSMGSRHDYAVRYYLSMSLGGREVVNVGDPRLREHRYRSLHPGDFSAFVFLDDGLAAWPPNQAQAQWLTENLRCTDNDPFDPFVLALIGRSSGPLDGFYPLSGTVLPALGPGQVWAHPPVDGGLCGG
jgi:hypothetical protein